MSDKYMEIQDYYGQQLKTSDDLQTNACCTLAPPPKEIREILKMVHDEVKDKYYGCGLTLPTVLTGQHILDLGSGSGRDVFIASKLVGPEGSVMGVDMTDEQLEVANKYVQYHTEKFGFSKPNVSFIKGNIDALDKLDLPEARLDIIISNCVINLAMDKASVLKEAFKLLKPGGEMYFSDVYCNRRVPEHLQKDPVLWGECLSGALYWNDFLNMAKAAGFVDPRVVESRRLTIESPEIEERLGDLEFYSVTYRLFKLDGLESDCEDYGQAVRYMGGIRGSEPHFQLDDHHVFPKNKMIPVCGNTYRMLHDTRFSKFFEFFGSWDVHYGIYEGCGGNNPYKEGDSAPESCC